MFDLVNPVLALGRLIDQGRKLGLDERRGVTRDMSRFVAASSSTARSRGAVLSVSFYETH